MKWILLNKQYSKYALSVLLGLLIYNISVAGNDSNIIIISGQITNMEHGSPVKGHTIYILNSLAQPPALDYSNTLITNDEGYYCDTIVTLAEKGSFLVQTYDYSGKLVDTTIYFRFFERNKSISIANFAFYTPYHPGNLQANFNYVQQTGDDRNKFSFFDQTKSDNITSWHWDFGDGTTSSLQNPTHEYQSFGLFKVAFTVTSNSNNATLSSTVTKQLFIDYKEYYHLGGHAFSEHFPIDFGYAYLYMIDSSENYIAIDTISFDTLGYYYFYQIPKGDYVVKVEPTRESEYYGILLPTYYGDKLFWDEAHIIHLINTGWEYNINMLSSEGLVTGEGSIGGNIEYVDRQHTQSNNNVCGVNIYLFDDFDNLITCHYSDEQGHFSFDPVEISTYWLYPEVIGVQAEKIKIELTPEIPDVSDIKIIIHVNNISYIIPDEGDYYSEIIGTPYPNPVSGTLSIPLGTTLGNSVSYEVYDMYGHKVYSGFVDTIIDSNSYQVSTADLKNGSYVLRTIVDNKLFDRVFIVAR